MQRFGNRTLRALPATELEPPNPHLAHVGLERRTVFCSLDQPIASVGFPEEALVSILSMVSEGGALATAMVGNEGMVGLPHFHTHTNACNSTSRSSSSRRCSAW